MDREERTILLLLFGIGVAAAYPQETKKAICKTIDIVATISRKSISIPISSKPIIEVQPSIAKENGYGIIRRSYFNTKKTVRKFIKWLW